MPLSCSHQEGPEAAHYQEHHAPALGADEVGRGAIAGPLTVGMVSFPAGIFQNSLSQALTEVTDSKQLSHEKRALLVPAIRQTASFWAVVHLSNKWVDSHGINPCTRLALERLLRRSGVAHLPGTLLLMDGKHKFHIGMNYPDLHCRTIVGGDASVLSIAAASILAKEARDARMQRFADFYPGYGFEKHKGYGTAEHLKAVAELGPCPLHRLSYLPKEDQQLELSWETQ